MQIAIAPTFFLVLIFMGPVYKYPDLFVPPNIGCGFKSLRVRTHPDSLRFGESARFRENDTNTLEMLTVHARLRMMNPRSRCLPGLAVKLIFYFERNHVEFYRKVCYIKVLFTVKIQKASRFRFSGLL